MFDIISDSKILVNTHIDDTEYAGNMRLFEGTGLGCLVLTDIKKELNNLFKIGKEIDVFENEKELIEKCKFYLSNIQKINTISLLGQKKTIENYNYEKRISILDEYIKSKLEKNEKIYNKLENFVSFVPNFSYFFSSNAISYFFSFFVIVLFARNYSPELFGKFTIAQTIFFIVYSISFSNIHYYLNKSLSINFDKKEGEKLPLFPHYILLISFFIYNFVHNISFF